MATATEYLGLTKPSEEEYVSVDVINENMEKIDEEAREARPVKKGGTGKTSWEANGIIYASAAEVLAQMAFPTTAGSFMRQDKSGAPYWSTPEQVLAAIGAMPNSTVPITKGGTGATDAATALANLGGARLGSYDAYFGGIYIGTNGVIPYIYNNGGDDIWFRYKNSAGTTLYTPFSLLMHATGNIPMTGDLRFNQGDVRTGQLGAYLTHLVLTSYGTNTVQFMLDNNTSLYNVLKLYFTPNGGSQSAYILYGTHNIPEGYYTGNGSATQRSIEIPSFLRGKCLLVFSDGYTDGVPDTVAIVTPMGGFSKNDSNEVTGFGKDTIRFSLDDSTNTGYLVINSTSECFNKNGVKYYYKGL